MAEGTDKTGYLDVIPDRSVRPDRQVGRKGLVGVLVTRKKHSRTDCCWTFSGLIPSFIRLTSARYSSQN